MCIRSCFLRRQAKVRRLAARRSDSLRKLIEFDLLEDSMGMLMEEWQPRRERCGPHVKDMLDPADAKTNEARLHDFALPESCARFVTCRDVGKLLNTF